MMKSNHVEFRKQRELGEIVSHTFTFLRSNAKPLFKVLLRTCSIPFVLLLVALIFYTRATQGANLVTVINTDTDIAGIVIFGIALVITGIIYNALLYGSTSEYIKSYVESGEQPNPDTVVEQIRSKTGKFISVGFGNLLVFIAAAIIPMGAAIFLFVSGIEIIGFLFMILTFVMILYLYVRFTVIYPVAANLEKSTSGTFFESARLVKNEWWMTLFTLIIMGILIGVIGFVFQIPVVIYTMVKAFTSFQSGVTDPTEIFDAITVALQVIGTAAGYILYVILAIAINFIYFNLNERKNQSGSLDRIDAIGNGNA